MKTVNVEFVIGDVVEIRDVANNHEIMYRGFVTAIEVNKNGNRFYVNFWCEGIQRAEFFFPLELTLADEEPPRTKPAREQTA